MTMTDWIGFLGAALVWVKAAHVIFVIFLIAGLFMLPRFFVYHQQSALGSAEDKAWIEREGRLLRIILNPSLSLVWVLGLLLVVNGGYWDEPWFLAKFILVIGLSAYHGWAAGYAKKLAKGERSFDEKRLRILNEVPGVATALIVILVIVRP